jgi:hypothetical protein
MTAGAHSVDLGAALPALPAGMYLVRVSQPGFTATTRLAHLAR